MGGIRILCWITVTLDVERGDVDDDRALINHSLCSLCCPARPAQRCSCAAQIVLVCCGAASACSDGVCADKAALVTALTNCDHLEVNCAAQNVKDWDVSAVTDMSSLFHYKHDFDGDLSSWDVSSVTTMNSMFGYAYSFSSDISNWDVSSVTDGHYLFYEADNFNADIGDWDVGSFTTMEAMFRQTFSFNRDLNGWDVGSVTNMQEMFRSQAGDEPHSRMGVTFPGGSPFNGDISSWDVASVSNMYEVFDNANRFNSDISDWDVSGATGNMAWLFADASAFNADLSRWDVGGVTNMNSMFKDAVSFDRDLGDWDIAAVTDSGNFIIRASAFRAETRCDPFYTGTTTDTCDAPREAIPVPPPHPRAPRRHRSCRPPRRQLFLRATTTGTSAHSGK